MRIPYAGPSKPVSTRMALLVAGSARDLRETFLGDALSVKLEDPTHFGGPFREVPASRNGIRELGPVEPAGVTRNRLNPAGALKSKLLIDIETLRDFLFVDSLQQQCEREPVFDRLPRTLADVRHHWVGGVAKEGYSVT
jgi:hypothetical protein